MPQDSVNGTDSLKILFISSYFCLPPATGSRIRTMHLLKSLAAKHRVTYLAFADDDNQRQNVEAARALCCDVKVVFREHRYSPVDLLKGLVLSTPFTVLNFHHPEMTALAAAAQHSGDYDLVHAEGLHAAQYVDLSLPIPRVLSTHAVEWTIVQRFAKTTTNPLKRLYATLTYRKLRRYEGQMYGKFDRTILVMEEERELASEMSPGAKLVVIPNGVNMQEYQPDPAVVEEPLTLVFCGVMDSRSNVDAVLYFVREILPLIRRDVPEVKLRLVGQRPVPAIQRLGEQPGIEVTGFVPDVKPLVQSSTVAVIPLRIGGGSRLKILEALALNRAVVSTTFGAEGLDLQDGEHLVFADSPAAFASATVALLRDPERRATLAAAGRQRVEEMYDWKAITAALPQLYETLAAK